MLDFVVPVKGALCSQDFETSLLPNLLATPDCDKSTSQLTLDMRRVDWIDLFPLGLLIMELFELASSWESVRILPPDTSPILPEEKQASEEKEGVLSNYIRRQSVCSFLDHWNFFKILADDLALRNVHCEIPSGSYAKWARSSDNPLNEILDLTQCMDTETLGQVETKLVTEESLSKLFERWVTLSIVDSRDLAKVIIHNLGENAIQHASYILPENYRKRLRSYTSMRLVKPIDGVDVTARRREWILQHRIEQATEIERKYLEAGPAVKGYLELIWIDNGAGVARTLWQSYRDWYNHEAIKPSEVLKWSFEEFSSRKPKIRTQDDNKTGLYWVGERVLNKKGFLRLRSGSSEIVLNGLNSEGPVQVNDNLAPLRGSHFQLIFPLADDTPVASRTLWFPTRTTVRKSHGSIESKVIGLGPLSRDMQSKLDSDHVNEQLGEYVDNEANRIASSFTPALVLDFKGFDANKEILQRILMPIVCKGSAITSPVVMINADDAILAILQTTGAFGKIKKEKLLLPIFFTNGTMQWLGAPNDSVEKALQMLFREGDLPIDNIVLDLRNIGLPSADFLDISYSNPQLIKINSGNNTARMLVTQQMVSEILVQASKSWWDKRIKSIAVFEDEYQYPTYYCKRFIDGRRLLEQQDTRAEIAKALVEWINLHPDIQQLITCTEAGIQIEAIANERTRIEYVFFRDPGFSDTDITQPRPLKPGTKLGIVTDVIGTGATIKALIRYVKVHGCTPVGVFGIIDTAPEHTENIEGIKTDTLAHFPTEKFPNKPKTWTQPSSTPVYPNAFPLTPHEIAMPLFPKQLLEDFWERARSAKAIFDGNWSYGQHHHEYYIKADQLLREDPGLARDIFTALRSTLDGTPDLVLMPSHTETLAIQDVVRTYFSSTRVIMAIRQADSPSALRAYTLPETYAVMQKGGKGDFQDKHVLVIDTGTITGGSLIQLCDIAFSYGARKVSIFILLNRLEPIRLASLLRASEGRPIRVLYFQQLYTNPHNAFQCPICVVRRKLQEILRSIESKEGRAGITKLLPLFDEHPTVLLTEFVSNSAKVLSSHNQLSFSQQSQQGLDVSYLIEDLNRTGLQGYIFKYLKNASLSDAYSFIRPLLYVGESVQSLPSEYIEVLVQSCRNLLMYPALLSIEQIFVLIEIWRFSQPAGFLDFLIRILKHINESSFFAPVLVALWDIAEGDPDFRATIAEHFRSCLQDLDHEITSMLPNISPRDRDRVLARRNLVLELRQDLWEVIPPSLDEIPSSAITAIHDEIVGVSFSDHLPLPRSISIILQGLYNITGRIRRGQQLPEASKQRILSELHKWVEPRSVYFIQLKKIQVNAAKLYQLGNYVFGDYTLRDYVRIPYFSDSAKTKSFYSDVSTIMRSLKALERTLIMQTEPPLKLLKNSQELLARIWERVFDADGELQRAISFYYPDLNLALEQIVGSSSERLYESGIDLEIDCPKSPVVIQVDNQTLTKMLDNFVTNALKYLKPSDPSIRRRAIFRVSPFKEVDRDLVELYYEDDGDFPGFNTLEALRKPKRQWSESERNLKFYAAKVQVPEHEKGCVIRVVFQGRLVE